MQKNNILQALQNDRKYLFSKRKIMKQPDRTAKPYLRNPVPVSLLITKQRSDLIVPRSFGSK